MRTPISRIARWVAAAAVVVTAAAPSAAYAATAAKKPQPTPTPAPAPTTALVLYDSSGTWGYLGELYATEVANLTGHFGTYTAEPVSKYIAGQLAKYTAAIYVGSSYGEALPTAVLDDWLATQAN